MKDHNLVDFTLSWTQAADEGVTWQTSFWSKLRKNQYGQLYKKLLILKMEVFMP